MGAVDVNMSEDKWLHLIGTGLYWIALSLACLVFGFITVWTIFQFPLFCLAWFGWCAFMLQLRVDVALWRAFKEYKKRRLTDSGEVKKDE